MQGGVLKLRGGKARGGREKNNDLQTLSRKISMGSRTLLALRDFLSLPPEKPGGF